MQSYHLNPKTQALSTSSIIPYPPSPSISSTSYIPTLSPRHSTPKLISHTDSLPRSHCPPGHPATSFPLPLDQQIQTWLLTFHSHFLTAPRFLTRLVFRTPSPSCRIPRVTLLQDQEYTSALRLRSTIPHPTPRAAASSFSSFTMHGREDREIMIDQSRRGFLDC